MKNIHKKIGNVSKKTLAICVFLLYNTMWKPFQNCNIGIFIHF